LDDNLYLFSSYCILSLAIILMMPLKNTQLAVIKVDKNGFVEVATQLDEEIISTNVALAKKLREDFHIRLGA